MDRTQVLCNGVLVVTDPPRAGRPSQGGSVKSRLRAWSSLGGIAFSVLLVAGSILLFDGPSGSSPAKMAAYYGSGSNRSHIHIGWVLAGLGLFFLVWFIAAVRERIAIAEQAEAGGASLLSTIVTVGGAAFVAVTLCVVALSDSIKTMSDDTYHHQVYSGVIHAANDASYMLLVSGGAAMASMILAVSLAIFGYGLLPRWVGWFGVAAAVAAIFSLFFFTMAVWLLWIAVTSVLLFLRARSPRATGEQPSAAVTAG
jgi:hypothetical protein